MAFVDRVVEHPNRWLLTPVSGEENTYDLTRAEGNVTEEGTLLNAENLNREIDDIAHGNIEEYIDSRDVQITRTGIDVFTDGAYKYLPEGYYVITAVWSFSTTTTSGTRNMEIRIVNNSGTVIGNARQRVMAAAGNYAILQAFFVGYLSEGTYKVRASSSRPCNAAAPTVFRALRIA